MPTTNYSWATPTVGGFASTWGGTLNTTLQDIDTKVYQIDTRQASDTAIGQVELATNAEVQTGTDAVRAVTPASLRACTATDARPGVVELATTAESKTGTDATRALTPAGFAGSKSLATDGYYTFPGGLTIQWGRYAGGSNDVPITFPVAFSAVYNVQVTAQGTSSSTQALTQSVALASVQQGSVSTTGFTAFVSFENETTDTFISAGTVPFYWFAVGVVA